MGIEEAEGRKMVSANINFTTWVLAKENLISFTDALDFGLRFKLAEKAKLGIDYPQNSLSIKIAKMSEIINQQASKIIELEEAIAFRETEKKDENKELTDTELKDILGNGEPK